MIADSLFSVDIATNTYCRLATGNKGALILTSEHMIIILIVFFALVLGMCASITISCWGKIKERRQREREYRLRRSREASVEVGLDRTMTITSLDHHHGGVHGHHPGMLTEHEIATQTQASMLGPAAAAARNRKNVNALTINRGKGCPELSGMGGMVEKNGCYVPEVDLSVFCKHLNGSSTVLDDKFSPLDTPPHLVGNAIAPDCPFHQAEGIRSGSESPIPP